MTSPPRQIKVECPRCGSSYEDWYRPSINLNLDDFDEDYLRQASTATCPTCGYVVELSTLVVQGDIWRLG
jgi:ribosomal protein S27AE